MKKANEILMSLKDQMVNGEYEELMHMAETAIKWATDSGADAVDILVGDRSDEAIAKCVETLKENGYRAYSWEQQCEGICKKVITIRLK